MIVSPSLLSADFLTLSSEIEMLNNSKADWIHLDIMDGMFVPNITFGFPVISQIKKAAKKPLDVHLMIEKPERYVKAFRKAGADILTVHYEAVVHLHRCVQEIKNEGMKAGVSLNPHTPVHVLEHILPDLNVVLLMSVNPGFGGQSFIPESMNKIRILRQLANEKNPGLIIEVDGGVSPDNVKKLADAGMNAAVAGSAVFKADDPSGVISELKHVN
ncbi:MAG: ribulose-phosphate 3-epimerase [Candidatus Delongbacteria bacterium]|jgi:ribulose-phosphate 3-epimerase|nr:ribulose-phosphate 3-epimerase [Candidatus Delongbacteria bacterium]